jgi:hypothetical protein
MKASCAAASAVRSTSVEARASTPDAPASASARMPTKKPPNSEKGSTSAPASRSAPRNDTTEGTGRQNRHAAPRIATTGPWARQTATKPSGPSRRKAEPIVGAPKTTTRTTMVAKPRIKATIMKGRKEERRFFRAWASRRDRLRALRRFQEPKARQDRPRRPERRSAARRALRPWAARARQDRDN